MASNEYPNHSRQLSDHLWRMYTKHELCDIYVRPLDGSDIPCHSCVLAAASSVICSCLNRNNVFAAWTKLGLECRAISHDMWLHILRFMYTGINTVPDELLRDAIDIATYLNMQDFLFMLQQKYPNYTPNLSLLTGTLAIKAFHLAELPEELRPKGMTETGTRKAKLTKLADDTPPYVPGLRISEILGGRSVRSDQSLDRQSYQDMMAEHRMADLEAGGGRDTNRSGNRNSRKRKKSQESDHGDGSKEKAVEVDGLQAIGYENNSSPSAASDLPSNSRRKKQKPRKIPQAFPTQSSPAQGGEVRARESQEQNSTSWQEPPVLPLVKAEWPYAVNPIVIQPIDMDTPAAEDERGVEARGEENREAWGRQEDGEAWGVQVKQEKKVMGSASTLLELLAGKNMDYSTPSRYSTPSSAHYTSPSPRVLGSATLRDDSRPSVTRFRSTLSPQSCKTSILARSLTQPDHGRYSIAPGNRIQGNTSLSNRVHDDASLSNRIHGNTAPGPASSILLSLIPKTEEKATKRKKTNKKQDIYMEAGFMDDWVSEEEMIEDAGAKSAAMKDDPVYKPSSSSAKRLVHLAQQREGLRSRKNSLQSAAALPGNQDSYASNGSSSASQTLQDILTQSSSADSQSKTKGKFTASKPGGEYSGNILADLLSSKAPLTKQTSPAAKPDPGKSTDSPAPFTNLLLTLASGCQGNESLDNGNYSNCSSPSNGGRGRTSVSPRPSSTSSFSTLKSLLTAPVLPTNRKKSKTSGTAWDAEQQSWADNLAPNSLTEGEPPNSLMENNLAQGTLGENSLAPSSLGENALKANSLGEDILASKGLGEDSLVSAGSGEAGDNYNLVVLRRENNLAEQLVKHNAY